jgi:hypothetical protein
MRSLPLSLPLHKLSPSILLPLSNIHPYRHSRSLSNQKQNQIPDPSFGTKLKELIPNRGARIVAVGAFSVLATIESIFWVKVAWAKFGLEDKEVEEKEKR